MKLHELAELFPAMSEPEFEVLKNDIAELGQLEPILMYKGKVVDGRHRMRACEELCIGPVVKEWEGTEDGLVRHALSLNLHRRHLNESQRALCAARLATLRRGQKAVAEISVSQTEAAKIFTVSPDSIQFARKVLDSKDKDIIKSVSAGTLAVSKAAKQLQKSVEISEKLKLKRQLKMQKKKKE